MHTSNDLKYQLNKDKIKIQELGFDKNTLIAFICFFIFSLASFFYINTTGFNNTIVLIYKIMLITLSLLVIGNYLIAYIKFKKSYLTINHFIKNHETINLSEFDQYEYKDKLLFVKEFNKGIQQLHNIQFFMNEHNQFDQLSNMKEMIVQTQSLYDYLLINPSQMTNVYHISNKAIGILEAIIKNYDKLNTDYNKDYIDQYTQEINAINEMIINETQDIIINKNNQIIDSIKLFASKEKTI